MRFKHLFLALGLIAAPILAFGASTINPTVPAANAPLASAPVRNNFLAAYNDVNNIEGKFASTIAPLNPSLYQEWMDTTTSTTPNFKIYAGNSWVSIGSFNCTSLPCVWSSGGSSVTTGGALTANRLVVGGGSSTISVLSSLGTTVTVLHGNAAGLPIFSAVDLQNDITNVLLASNGGTNNAFTAFSGPASSVKTFTLPNASATLLTTAAGVTNAQLAAMAADTIKVNFTGGSATPTDTAVPNCPDSGGNHLNYAVSTHTLACGTSGATNGPLWKIQTSGTQSISTSTRTLLHGNSAVYDPSSICNVSSTWVCTPNVAGYYSVTCTARIDGSNGPPARSTVAQTEIVKNGLAGTSAGLMETSAQLDLTTVTVSNWVTFTTIVQVNGTTDTIGCAVYSDDLTAVVQNAQWDGHFIHS